VDVGPTLLARAGADVPDAMQGLDLASGLADRSESDRMVFAEEDHEGNVLRAVRTTRWKWIEANEGNPRGLPEAELFDISADPDETNDRAEAETAVADELRAHAKGQRLLAESGKVGEASEARVSAAELEYLEALGYVQGDEEAELP
jgi:arylsulfatase A-like enzyme